MLNNVLIANRGEIACRIIRTARRLGIRTVAVCSEADRRAAHVAAADEAMEIGPAPAAESYLRIDRIIAAAKASGADSIHPGNGFLSENPEFAEACRRAGLIFIGPSPEAMRRLGDKAAAKVLAESLGIPVVPGCRDEAQDAARLEGEAARLGFPVVIKAAAGGGGRGMRIVERAADFRAALDSASREATSAFGDGRVLLEKFIERPRHVEVQVFGDRAGNFVHLFERDCSLQRRHQKVIEEAPAPGISAELREALTGAALKLAGAARYEGAGTVEFLVGGGTLGKNAPWYFIEANTRLQVEHPVTEEVTGVDLVEWQFRVAAGEPLPARQNEIAIRGHSVEARLYAEDPASGFLPSTGRVIECSFEPAPGLRIETALRAGDEVTSYYDPMLAKVIATGRDRAEAFARLGAALSASLVIGPRTNAAFLKRLVDHPEVSAGRLDTGLIARELERLAPGGFDRHAIRIGARELLELERRCTSDCEQGYSAWKAEDGFQLGGERRLTREVVVNGRPVRLEIAWGPAGAVIGGPELEPEAAVGMRARTIGDRGKIYVLNDLHQTVVSWPEADLEADGGAGRGGAIRAPISGHLIKMFAAEGAMIEKGDRIAVVEAMKMEHVIHAPRAARIARVAAAEGQQVAQGALIAEIDEEEGQ